MNVYWVNGKITAGHYVFSLSHLMEVSCLYMYDINDYNKPWDVYQNSILFSAFMRSDHWWHVVLEKWIVFWLHIQVSSHPLTVVMIMKQSGKIQSFLSNTRHVSFYFHFRGLAMLIKSRCRPKSKLWKPYKVFHLTDTFQSSVHV